MPNPTKLVNNVEVEMTDEEVAQGVADAEAYDLNLSYIRRQRDDFLQDSDRTMIEDFPRGDDSLEDWKTYRQALRDYMAEFDRQSTQTAWPKSPIIARVGQAAYDAESDAEAKDIVRADAESAAGYPGPGI
jgi:hypothetical protein